MKKICFDCLLKGQVIKQANAWITADNNTCLNNATRYNSMFNQWESMAPMPETVLHPAVAATNQRIYMFGGEDSMQNPVRLIQVRQCSPVTVCICSRWWLYSFIYFHSSIYSICVSSPLSPLPFCRCITLPGTCGLRWRTEQ